jgi:hypothetical protein
MSLESRLEPVIRHLGNKMVRSKKEMEERIRLENLFSNLRPAIDRRVKEILKAIREMEDLRDNGGFDR